MKRLLIIYVVYAILLAFGIPINGTKTAQSATEAVTLYFERLATDDPAQVYALRLSPEDGGTVSYDELSRWMERMKWGSENLSVKLIRIFPERPLHLRVTVNRRFTNGDMREMLIDLYHVDGAWKVASWPS